MVWVYSPNASTGLKRIDYRVNEWDKDFFNFVRSLEKNGKPVIIGGDLNVCRSEIDIIDPARWVNSPCFTKMERNSFESFLNSGFIDWFRYLYPYKEKFSAAGKYQSIKKALFENQGWRIDYFIVSKNIIKAVQDTDIHDNILGSDHVPIQK